MQCDFEDLEDTSCATKTLQLEPPLALVSSWWSQQQLDGLLLSALPEPKNQLEHWFSTGAIYRLFPIGNSMSRVLNPVVDTHYILSLHARFWQSLLTIMCHISHSCARATKIV